MTDLEDKVRRIQGPILVLGASGFVGSALLKEILRLRDDVYGTVFHTPAWRLEGLPSRNVLQADLLVDSNLDLLLETIRPKTVFNCVVYGAYAFETDRELIYRTNFNLTERLLTRLKASGVGCYIHAGSSSEYGSNCTTPAETDPLAPNNDYAVSKAACSGLLHYYGKTLSFPCANLRMYAVYGPGEDSSRLIPTLVRAGSEGRYPPLVDQRVTRDFVYIDDVVEVFLDAALNLKPGNYGEAFNVGSGKKTTIAEVAETARRIFDLKDEPTYRTLPDRAWDLTEWYSTPAKAREVLGWQSRTTFPEGLRLTAEWYRGLEDKEKYHQSSKKFELDRTYSVSAVVACYKDGQAIPIMYERLKAVFEKLKIDYEIIFVNDNSPDDSEKVITELSSKDRRVIGLSHSRNFGSQAAFRSGIAISVKNACVLLDGDLQDPPELIEQFVDLWRQGNDVVYGRRVKRKGPLFMQLAYKLFYRIFDYFSYLKIPHDAGDFSLIDRRVVQAILRFPERDFFLRGVRAFVGFKQVGVDYTRPERKFGRSTNNLLKNIGWAKKGILSFSYTPLTILSFFGTALLGLSVLLSIYQIGLRLLFPSVTPNGLTTVLLVILFFGSINLFALAVLGEYIAKIFEEVKQRPHFVRRAVIKNGEVRLVTTDSVEKAV